MAFGRKSDFLQGRENMIEGRTGLVSFSPASVRLVLRVVRDRSAIPNRCSSCLIVWLTADGETPNSRAAAEKLLVSATAFSARRPLSWSRSL